MLDRNAAPTLCEQVLARAKAAGADDAEASPRSSTEAYARFADNRISTSRRADDHFDWRGWTRSGRDLADCPQSGQRSRPDGDEGGSPVQLKISEIGAAGSSSASSTRNCCPSLATL